MDDWPGGTSQSHLLKESRKILRKNKNMNYYDNKYHNRMADLDKKYYNTNGRA